MAACTKEAADSTPRSGREAVVCRNKRPSSEFCNLSEANDRSGTFRPRASARKSAREGSSPSKNARTRSDDKRDFSAISSTERGNFFRNDATLLMVLIRRQTPLSLAAKTTYLQLSIR